MIRNTFQFFECKTLQINHPPQNKDFHVNLFTMPEYQEDTE